MTELAKAMAKVSDILPQTQLHLVLYPTEQMKRVVEELYALIISFYQRALRWYEASRLKHVAKALFKPFSLEFGDLVERINTQSRSIERLAITLAHQEIRSIYRLVRECLSEQRDSRSEQNKAVSMLTDAQQLQTQTLQLLVSMQQMLICKSITNAKKKELTAIAHQTVNSGTLLTTQRMTRETQVALMIATTSSLPFLSPHEGLRRRIALCSRRYTASSMDLDGFLISPTLKAWSSGIESSLLIISGTLSMRSESLMTGAYMTELIRSSKAPVVWALKGTTGAKAKISACDLLQHLTMQALQLNANAVGERVSPSFNAALVASATNEEDWLKVFQDIVSIFPTLFVVVEADFLGSTGRDGLQIQELMRLLQDFVRKHTKPPVKVVMFNYRRSQTLTHGTSCSQNDRTHTLFLNRFMRDYNHQRKIGNLRSALRRQHASSFQGRVKRQALI